MDKFETKEVPVREGDIIDDVEIISVGEKGDGIAKVDGFVVIVPGAKKGEVVTIKIGRVLAKYAFSELTDA